MISPCGPPNETFFSLKILITSTHLYQEPVCPHSSLRQSHMPNDPTTLEFVSQEGNTHLSARQRGTAAEETSPSGCCSLHFSPPLTLSFRLTCQAEKNSFATRERNHLQVCTEDHVPAEIRTCAKRSSPSNKVASFQRSIKYLWADNPLQIIHF